MTITELSTLIHFNTWANNQILTTCEQLTQEEFTQALTPNPGWGSIRGILVHMLDTEWGWRTQLQPDLEDIILKESDFPDMATVKARWEVEQKAWLELMEDFDSQKLQQTSGTDPENSMTVWQVMMHTLFHSMQHRSEVATFLTGFGHSPGELDLSTFLRQSRRD